jgi:hypothetical protein
MPKKSHGTDAPGTATDLDKPFASLPPVRNRNRPSIDHELQGGTTPDKTDVHQKAIPADPNPEESDGDDYDVGYGKPPKHTRWKKGRSANPKGRKTGSKNTRTVYLSERNTRVYVVENGRRRQLTMLELAFKALFTGAAKGKVPAISKVLECEEKFIDGTGANDHGSTSHVHSTENVSERDREIIEDFLREYTGELSPIPEVTASDNAEVEPLAEETILAAPPDEYTSEASEDAPTHDDISEDFTPRVYVYKSPPPDPEIPFRAIKDD